MKISDAYMSKLASHLKRSLLILVLLQLVWGIAVPLRLASPMPLTIAFRLDLPLGMCGGDLLQIITGDTVCMRRSRLHSHP